MSDIVYVLGAGANQSVLNATGRRPPLSSNFFTLTQATRADRSRFFRPTKSAGLYDYIKYYWKKNRRQLASEPFDLEELFTLLQLQMSDALQQNDMNKYRLQAAIYDQITNWLASYLEEFEGAPVYQSPVASFGSLLLREAPTIITFNYDCIIESAIAYASGPSHTPTPAHNDTTSGPALTFSYHNWNRALCYGIAFDEVELPRAGPAQAVSGQTFYSHPQNKLYPNPILKLHGSINWYRYVPVRAVPSNIPQGLTPPTGSILQRRSDLSGVPVPRNGWMTKRELVTPVLYKHELLQTSTFRILWQRALTELSACRRLVIVGYSFPPTDFGTKRLFLEAFAKRPPLEELVIVNPDPALHLIRRLTHHDGPIMSLNNLEAYVTAFG